VPVSLHDTVFEIQHDHTQLEVLFEDLLLIARQAFMSAEELELMEDASAQWSCLQQEIAGHFGREERKIFSPLGSAYPEHAETLQALSSQHQTLRHELVAFEQLLRGSAAEVASHQKEFEARWATFAVLWQAHSELEWKLLQTIRERMERDAGSDEEEQP